MADTAIPTDTDKRRRVRSPAYPFINLEIAIARAKQFYDKEARNSAHLSVAAKHWGFVEGGSNGAQIAATLISFGLLQDEGANEKRKVSLTQNALRILLDTRPDSKDRTELIKQVALAPKIHKQLWDKWGNNLPSDAQLRHSLLLEWETPFNERAIDNFIKEYRDTIAFSGLSDSDTVALEVESGGSRVTSDPLLASVSVGASAGITPDGVSKGNLPLPLGSAHQDSLSSPKKHVQEFVVPLSDGNKAVFQWPNSLSREDVDDLKDSLKILERKISRSTGERQE